MINSQEAMEYLASHLGNALAVASLGHVKYELAAANERPENFYLWNSMGMACSIGLGMATAQPDRRVIVLDGDGALLMNLNSLASEGWRAPRNLVHVVFDNRAHYLTGRQPTATSARADLARIAEGAGFPHAERVETLAAFSSAVDRALVEEGPWFLHALVEQQPRTGKPPKSPTLLRHRFMDALGVQV
ncbi:MAG TPA: thiamine pyrophosphate-dependent enzyme [bacterium]|nr:thiamine pyrophosphate-dependent enzyme [bacterium]